MKPEQLSLLGHVRQQAIAYLTQKGDTFARTSVDTLFPKLLGLEKLHYFTTFDRPLEPQELTKLRQAVKRRSQAEPIAYILESTNFCGLELYITPDVLIPRVETEGLIEHFLQHHPSPHSTIVDICTGSGCLAITVKHKLPHAQVRAIDICPKALEVAKHNAKTHAVSIEWSQLDILQTPIDAPDYIISNPPYVTLEEYDTLDKDVRHFEPKLALVAPHHGLAFYQHFANAFRNTHTQLFLEIGASQEKALRDIFSSWIHLDILPDLFGNPRYLIAHNRATDSSFA